MKRTSFLAVALAVAISASAGAQTQVTEHFDDDPTPRGWSGVNNRTAPQDYGFDLFSDVTGSDVNPPGGTASGAGEFGGTMARQAGTANGGTDNFYGVDINGEIDISTQGFTVKGVIHLQEPDGGSGFYLGYSRGVSSYGVAGDAGNANNFIGIQYDDSRMSIPITFSSGGGRDRDTSAIGILDLVQGLTVPFSMIYDPSANGGSGSLAFEVNGSMHTWNLPGGVNTSMDPLTHFGIMPVSADGADAIIWFDDFEYTAFTGGIPGDVNNDGFVDIFDVNVVSANWGSPGGPTGDANGDGNVDIFDVNLISANWSPPPAPGGAAAVPEPATAILAMFGLLAVALRRWRTR